MLILLSGEIATGKTALSKYLEGRYLFRRVSTGAYLNCLAGSRGLAANRDTLKLLGDSLDETDRGEWVVKLVEERILADRTEIRWSLDSVRRDFQIPWIRQRFQRVLHIHLTASDEIKRARYEDRRNVGGEYSEFTSYDEAKQGATELHVRELAHICDVLIDTDELNVKQAADLVMRHSGG